MNDIVITVIRFFQDGGPFMFPIGAVLAIGLAITLERWLHLSIARAKNRRMIAKLMPLVAKGEIASASKLAQQSNATVSRILLQGMEHYKTARRRDDFEAAMDESIMEAIPRLEKRTHYLAMFANIATLLGLLGTIIGLIKAFTAVAQVNPAEKAELLSASISIAMNNTAFALMVAIPFLLIHAFLQARTTEIVDSLEAAKISFLNLIHRGTAEAVRGAE